MSTPHAAHLCEAGHYYFDEDPYVGEYLGDPKVKIPRGCPCGRPFLARLFHYGSQDPNECRWGEDRPPLPFVGHDTFTRKICISNAVNRKGVPIEAYQLVAHQFPRYDVTKLKAEVTEMPWAYQRQPAR